MTARRHVMLFAPTQCDGTPTPAMLEQMEEDEAASEEAIAIYENLSPANRRAWLAMGRQIIASRRRTH